MLRTFGAVLAAATLALAGGFGSARAAEAPPSPSPSPSPSTPIACPPALPIGGLVTGATATSVTVTYSVLFLPPCGYDPPITVTLFGSREDAAQWRDPVAEAVSEPQRYGNVTVDGLTPDTEYWFRFSDTEGRRDPYVIGGPARTTLPPVCHATATIDVGWGSGFLATVTVRNTSGQQLDGWRVSWRWSGDERLQSLWDGVAHGSGADVTVRNASYNGTLAPGGSTTFGLVAATSAVPGSIALTCGR
ncbi:endoglucanase [Micromonospora craterilacus]|uniref:Endoglucanase n=1 Tax=Micromonospora craterilacus TaxID=1655439 RepID=A0A2W2DYY7_9ACTN|nr:cellulose binding domain-containing protein [Micromonospora craterilacus]PZG17146.1 endoglucanase [Micromonospora craterilacus]